MSVVRKKVCHHCKAPFTTSQISAKYCSDECKADVKNLKAKKVTQAKAERRVSRLRRTGFGQYLVRECIRAKTIQILSLHTAETLHQLDQLRTGCFIANGSSDEKSYELSHICPANSKGLVGLLHPHNLIIADKTFNRKRGTDYSGGGLFINRLSLKTEWHVDSNTPVSQVYAKIEKLLGPILKEYLEEHSPKLSYKERIINKLIRKALSEQVFDSATVKKAWEDKTRRTLHYQDIEELEQMALAKELKLFTFDKCTTRHLPLMTSEVERFKSYGVEIDPTFYAHAEYLHSLESFCATGVMEIDNNDYRETEFTFDSIQYWMAKQLNKLLHREKPERLFNGKPFTQCFTLPTTVSADWTPSHRIEEWAVAQHGMPAIEVKVLSYMDSHFLNLPMPGAVEVTTPWDDSTCPF